MFVFMLSVLRSSLLLWLNIHIENQSIFFSSLIYLQRSEVSRHAFQMYTHTIVLSPTLYICMHFSHFCCRINFYEFIESMKSKSPILSIHIDVRRYNISGMRIMLGMSHICFHWCAYISISVRCALSWNC